MSIQNICFYCGQEFITNDVVTVCPFCNSNLKEDDSLDEDDKNFDLDEDM